MVMLSDGDGDEDRHRVCVELVYEPDALGSPRRGIGASALRVAAGGCVRRRRPGRGVRYSPAEATPRQAWRRPGHLAGPRARRLSHNRRRGGVSHIVRGH